MWVWPQLPFAGSPPLPPIATGGPFPTLPLPLPPTPPGSGEAPPSSTRGQSHISGHSIFIQWAVRELPRFDTEYDRAKVPPYTGSPFASRPITISIMKGTRGVSTRYDTVLLPFSSIVRCPGRPFIPVPDRLTCVHSGATPPALLSSFAGFSSRKKACLVQSHSPLAITGEHFTHSPHSCK